MSLEGPLEAIPVDVSQEIFTPLSHGLLSQGNSHTHPTKISPLALERGFSMHSLIIMDVNTKKPCSQNKQILPYDPAILLLGLHPRKTKVCVHIKIHTVNVYYSQ